MPQPRVVVYGVFQMARIILALLALVILTFAGEAQETGRPASGASRVSAVVKEPEPNVAEARRRIAKAKAEGSNELDLGALSLRDIPEEVYELTNLKRLYLGLALVARQSALVGEEDKKVRNRIATVPAKLFTVLARTRNSGSFLQRPLNPSERDRCAWLSKTAVACGEQVWGVAFRTRKARNP